MLQRRVSLIERCQQNGGRNSRWTIFNLSDTQAAHWYTYVFNLRVFVQTKAGNPTGHALNIYNNTRDIFRISACFGLCGCFAWNRTYTERLHTFNSFLYAAFGYSTRKLISGKISSSISDSLLCSDIGQNVLAGFNISAPV